MLDNDDELYACQPVLGALCFDVHRKPLQLNQGNDMLQIIANRCIVVRHELGV